MVEVHADAVLFRHRFQHAQALRHHFLADPVAGDDRDPILLVLLAHREFPSSLFFQVFKPFPPSLAAPTTPFIGSDCNGPKPATVQRCTAMLTVSARSLTVEIHRKT